MHAPKLLSLVPLLALASGAPTSDAQRTAKKCPSYTIINTRGTTEPQGESVGFRNMNSRILSAVPGGKIYATVYPAAVDQMSEAGTADIVRKITETLETSPKECFILEGYSQGAQATVNALPLLKGKAFHAVKGVFFLGNPAHKAGLKSNVDNNGGRTTLNVNGISYRPGNEIPPNWVPKTLDVCILGDGVCDTTNSGGEIITPEHLQYPSDGPTQDLGMSFVIKRLGV